MPKLRLPVTSTSLRPTTALGARGVLFVATSLLSACGGGEKPGPGEPVLPRVAAITVSPSGASIDADSVATFTAVAKAANGESVANVNFTWQHSQPAVGQLIASQGASVQVVGRDAGQDTITVSVGQASARAVLTVRGRRVLQASLSPERVEFGAIGSSLSVVLRLSDQYGARQAIGTPAWSTLDPAVASVDASGRLTSTGNGSTYLIASVDGVADTVPVGVHQVPVLATNARDVYPKAIAFYAGDTVHLRLTAVDSNGHAVDPGLFRWVSDLPDRVGVDSTGLLRASATGLATIRIEHGGAVWSEMRAFVVDGAREAFSLTSLSAGGGHVCGLSSGGRLHCWGDNAYRQLGTAGVPDASQLRPAIVADTLRFGQVSAGDQHTCALDLDGLAYCWGRNWTGQLGMGEGGYDAPSGTSTIASPVAVLGGYRYTRIATSNTPGSSGNGIGSTCGLTREGLVACWGSHLRGQLGRPAPRQCNAPASQSCDVVPAPILGDRTWRDVDVGGMHACALTTEGQAYCWGYSTSGQLGIAGKGPLSADEYEPQPVTTSVRFTALALGSSSSCALTAVGALYCWGAVAASAVPALMPGGLSLRAIDVGSDYVCGVDAEGAVYCWGLAGRELLGDGGVRAGAMPRRVHGLTGVTTLSTGLAVACAARQEGVYCWGSHIAGALGIGAVPSSLGVPLTAIPVQVKGP